MKKKIWVIHHYATRMYTDRGGRHYWLCRELKKLGYEPVLFCAATVHNSREKVDLEGQFFRVQEAEGVPFVFVDAPAYRGNGVSRFWNMLAFTHRWKALVPDFVRRFGAPDLICGSSSEPFCVVGACQAAKRLGVPCIGEIRDIWPDILVGMGALSPHHPATLLLSWAERRIYRRSDALIFTIPGGMQYLRDKGYDRFVKPERVFYLNNGVDLAAFDQNAQDWQEPDAILDDPSFFRVVYTGSITETYEPDMLLDAAKLVWERGERQIRFLCWGEGRALARLRRRVAEEKIQNVEFRGFVDRYRIPAVLSRGDCSLLHCGELASARYGISYMKLFDYLAAGKPIVSTFSMGYNLLEAEQCGVTAPHHDAESFADTVIGLSRLSAQERAAMGERARKAAGAYDMPVLARKLSGILEQVLGDAEKERDHE